MLLVKLTAQEGRLAIDTDASLNTNQVSCAMLRQGICLPWPWTPAPLAASKPAELLPFYSGANSLRSAQRLPVL